MITYILLMFYILHRLYVNITYMNIIGMHASITSSLRPVLCPQARCASATTRPLYDTSQPFAWAPAWRPTFSPCAWVDHYFIYITNLPRLRASNPQRHLYEMICLFVKIYLGIYFIFNIRGQRVDKLFRFSSRQLTELTMFLCNEL